MLSDGCSERLSVANALDRNKWIKSFRDHIDFGAGNPENGARNTSKTLQTLGCVEDALSVRSTKYPKYRKNPSVLYLIIIFVAFGHSELLLFAYHRLLKPSSSSYQAKSRRQPRYTRPTSQLRSSPVITVSKLRTSPKISAFSFNRSRAQPKLHSNLWRVVYSS